GWDMQMLGLELKDLGSLGADLSILGFTDKELKDALKPEASAGLTDEDAVPELAQTPVTQPGDIWQLGPHRIACGDCTNAAVFAVLLGSLKPILMVTDPPYGVAYDPTWRHR